jgi:hypothetical protein
MAWVGVTPEMLQKELAAGLDLCDVVAMAVDVARVWSPELVDGVFVRFTVKWTRRVDGYPGVVFAPNLQVAMIGMLGAAKEIKRQEANMA